jgi:methylenetetrahydrofolate--tRNA-(uracil-5-)-methyltransferase
VCLTKDLQLKTQPRVFFAGQITGVEGYVESTAMGLIAGISAFMAAAGTNFHPPGPSTCVGALIRYLTTEHKHFQPMNINFGLIEGYSKKYKETAVATALAEIDNWKKEMLDSGKRDS